MNTGISNIPQVWQPIVSKYRLFESSPTENIRDISGVQEMFVSGANSITIVESVFIIVAAVLMATILTFTFYWAYNREKTLFITLLSSFIFAYSVMNIIGFAVARSQLGDFFFKIYLGAALCVAFLSAFLIIFFSVQASRRMKSGSVDLGSQNFGQ